MTHWVAKNNLAIVEVQHLLGHEHLDTMTVYVGVAGPQDAEALATLQDEKDASLDKWWKAAGVKAPTLRYICGISGGIRKHKAIRTRRRRLLPRFYSGWGLIRVVVGVPHRVVVSAACPTGFPGTDREPTQLSLDHLPSCFIGLAHGDLLVAR